MSTVWSQIMIQLISNSWMMYELCSLVLTSPRTISSTSCSAVCLPRHATPWRAGKNMRTCSCSLLRRMGSTVECTSSRQSSFTSCASFQTSRSTWAPSASCFTIKACSVISFLLTGTRARRSLIKIIFWMIARPKKSSSLWWLSSLPGSNLQITGKRSMTKKHQPKKKRKKLKKPQKKSKVRKVNWSRLRNALNRSNSKQQQLQLMRQPREKSSSKRKSPRLRTLSPRCLTSLRSLRLRLQRSSTSMTFEFTRLNNSQG